MNVTCLSHLSCSFIHYTYACEIWGKGIKYYAIIELITLNESHHHRPHPTRHIACTSNAFK